MWDFLFGWMIGRGIGNASLPDSVKQQRWDARVAKKVSKRERRRARGKANAAWWKARSPHQKLAIVLVIVAAVVAIVVYAELHPPISKQNCSQLAATQRHIASVKPSDSSWGKSLNDAYDVRQRVIELGGCPGEPDLQP